MQSLYNFNKWLIQFFNYFYIYKYRNFWEIVHAMTYDQKKKLLMFVTASDRVPLKGLGNLTFVIQRNGPDTDR